MADRFMTTTPASRAAGVSEATVRMWARLGFLPFEATENGVRLFRLEDVVRVARERAARRGVVLTGGDAA